MTERRELDQWLSEQARDDGDPCRMLCTVIVLCIVAAFWMAVGMAVGYWLK